MVRRIAMWSGPRNISTAMMRAWGNRPDTIVCDEPLYACYLKATGIDHPGRKETLSHHTSDSRKVIAQLTGPIPAPGNETIFYQKHMAHHLLDEIDRGWLDEVTNCFLIRDPREMLTSLCKVIPNPTIADTGLPQQVEIFKRVKRKVVIAPPVLDAKDMLENPEKILRLLCSAVGVTFDEAMLSWPPGPRDTDGIWAKHWYASVEQSTGFMPYTPKSDPLPEHLTPLYDACMKYYELLFDQRLN